MKFDMDTSEQITTKTRDMIFDDLKNGDIFREDGEDILFIRMATLSTDWDSYNAVNLIDGTTEYFCGDEKVEKYNSYVKLFPNAFINKITTD